MATMSEDVSDPAARGSPAVPERGSTSSQGVSGRFGRRRRQSKSERINEILKNAKDRADEMGSDPASIRQYSTFGRRPARIASADDAAEDNDDDDADERAGARRRRSDGREYQAVSSTAVGGAPSGSRCVCGSRSRRTDDGGGVELCNVCAAEEEEARPWWKRVLARYQSIELENKGSVARDHLALERTFLAWLRTSLAFASIGIAVTQLFRLNTSLAADRDDREGFDGHNSSSSSGGGGSNRRDTLRRLGRPLGAAFLAISILILLLGFKRYFHGQEWILKGKFPASRGTIVLVSLVGLAIMAASLVVVIVIHPPEDE